MRVPKRISVRAETSPSYTLEVKEFGSITHFLPFPGLVAGWNWAPVSLEVGLGGYPAINWMIGGRARPGLWMGHAVYFGTQAQFSSFFSEGFLWFQSVEGGYELATDVGFTLLAGGGVYFHVVDEMDGAPVTPMGRIGIGWAFIDP